MYVIHEVELFLLMGGSIELHELESTYLFLSFLVIAYSFWNVYNVEIYFLVARERC